MVEALIGNVREAQRDCHSNPREYFACLRQYTATRATMRWSRARCPYIHNVSRARRLSSSQVRCSMIIPYPSQNIYFYGIDGPEIPAFPEAAIQLFSHHHSHYKLFKRPHQDIHTPPWYRRHILRVPISPHASYSPRRFAISNNLSRLHGGRTPAVGHLCLSYSFYPNGYVGSGAH